MHFRFLGGTTKDAPSPRPAETGSVLGGVLDTRNWRKPPRPGGFELKDKLRDVVAAGDPEAAVNLPAEQAVHALVNLGYNASDADKTVRAVLSEKGTAETAELIRESLQLLVKAK